MNKSGPFIASLFLLIRGGVGLAHETQESVNEKAIPVETKAKIQLAVNLAEYGSANRDELALMTAAMMLKTLKHPVVKGANYNEHGNGNHNEKDYYQPDKLLQIARDIIQSRQENIKDPFDKIIDMLEQMGKTMGGPLWGYHYHTWYDIYGNYHWVYHCHYRCF